MNYYKILDINPNCSKQDLKKRYKELVKLYHPDNNQTGDLHKFHEVSQAYRSLTQVSRESSPYHYYYPRDPIKYPSQFTQRYAKNSTFISVLAGCFVLVTSFHFYYLQQAHASFIQQADKHHMRSSGDLKKARTEAKLLEMKEGSLEY
ncbi:unnamed protein product [Rhizopus stolonifer]